MKTKTAASNTFFGWATWLNVLVGGLLLIWHLNAKGGIPFQWQFIYFLAMITLTGIPHGALDHVIAMETVHAQHKKFRLDRFLGKYVVVILVYTAAWILFPAASLLFFLIISAWHFGETDIRGNESDWKVTLARASWGILVLMVMLLTHPQDVKWVIMRITQQSHWITAGFDWLVVYAPYVCLFLFAVSAAALSIAHLNKTHFFKLQHFFKLGIVLYLCTLLPLLPAFALYFAGWHAVKSYELIFGFLKRTDKYKSSSPLGIWKESLPLTFMAIYGLLFMAYVWNASGWNADPVPIIFIFLSVITLPHLDVMDKMLKS